MATIPDLNDAASYRVKKIKGHHCKLLCEEDIICQHITSGFFVRLRRAFRTLMMISPHDPRAKFLAKSTCRMKIEERRQLERYYYMIHPFSDFNYYWLTILSITHVIILFCTPLYGMQRFPHELQPWEPPVQQIVVAYFSLIILVSFFVGYYDKDTDQVILNPRKVAVKYLRSHFIFDVLSTCTYSVVTGNYESEFAAWMSRASVVFRMSRLFTIIDFIDAFQMKTKVPSYICKPLKMTLVCVLFIVWLTFFNYAVHVHHLPINQRERDLVIMAVIHVLRKYCLIDIFAGPYNSIAPITLYISTISLHISKLFEVWLTAQIFQIFTSYMKVHHRYDELLYQIKTYIRVKDLPFRLSRRIYKYLNFRLQYSVFQEERLVENLSSTLKKDILWHTCQNLVTEVEVFKDLPPHVTIKMVSRMKPEIFLPNDVIVNAGEIGNEMYFIYVGILAVFTESGQEICHLAEGSHFGEIALLLSEFRVASVVAIDFCQLYRLTKKDFQEVIEPYPSIKASILKLANERFLELRVISGKRE